MWSAAAPEWADRREFLQGAGDVAFGGGDGKTLFVTREGKVYELRITGRGASLR